MNSALVSSKIEQLKSIKWAELIVKTIMPMVGIALFLMIWHTAAPSIKTSLGDFPQPKQVFEQWGNLVDEYSAEQAREAQFYERQEKRNAELASKDPEAKLDERPFSGRPTFFDKIETSLVTVLSGFLVATIIAIPVGIMIGLSQTLYNAINPLIQLFKPVSPLAWFPIVFVFTTWGIDQAAPESLWQRALFTSAGVVTLCSLWPTLVNTAVGVAAIDKDHLNVAKALKLGWCKRIWKIVLPSSLPLIFTGLRVSIGVGWMVLVAADMMSQNQGLGKFVWDMYQNGDTASTAQIIIAVFFIGTIGFALDRIMLIFQRLVTFEEQTI